MTTSYASSSARSRYASRRLWCESSRDWFPILQSIRPVKRIRCPSTIVIVSVATSFTWTEREGAFKPLRPLRKRLHHSYTRPMVKSCWYQQHSIGNEFRWVRHLLQSDIELQHAGLSRTRVALRAPCCINDCAVFSSRGKYFILRLSCFNFTDSRSSRNFFKSYFPQIFLL